MKKIAVLLTLVATLAGSAGYAQPAGKGSANGTNAASNGMAWGIGLVGLGVLATVVGLTVAAATHDASCAHSH